MSLDTKKLLVNANLSPFIHLHEQIWHETQKSFHTFWPENLLHDLSSL